MAKWYALHCTDCGMSIAYSHEPIQIAVTVYCSLCANCHAEVASYMMPVGNSNEPFNNIQEQGSGVDIVDCDPSRSESIHLGPMFFGQVESGATRRDQSFACTST